MTKEQKIKFANYILNWLKEEELIEDNSSCIDQEQLEETCMAGTTICEALVEAGIVSEIGGQAMNDKVIFLQSFKGKTVDEVIEILLKTEEQVKEEQTLFEKKKVEWYKSCIGKYFVIQHNEVAFTLVHIKEKEISKGKNYINYRYDNLFEFAWDCYHIVLSDKPKFESNAGFNVLWLNNPFERSIINSDNTVKEISKEKFDEITSSFDLLINKTKQILK